MNPSRRDAAPEDTETATGADAGVSDDDDARTDTATDATTDGVPPGGDPRVALFVDGPNVLREEFDVDLDDVREAAAAFGRPAATRLYLDEHATPGLIQAAEARGFEVVVTSGDVDVRLAVDLTRFAVEGRADVVAVASRDTDFKPAIETANAYGLRTVAIAPGAFGRSDALRNAATESVTLGDDEDGPSLVGYDG
ncbi:NYN domain-containing protein [Halogeometricum sp. S1BR25-6]|uniref:NYN domain-containing protein n=1 Tax=Halogeometricum salsisoli TaxID=2950536 RepID=A0ABU2GG26_9EURY|nr:NYN domain-containing protein [Halogeometricum sp. S1BR25-6]MDS0299406.1 NYN domain-containing protein [Halogeometricum sp. S1BR25-6]